ncbi:hypothetical protein GUJ93_ZPchr0016g2558 [Zizania palustris]|uniref:FH2 domain-containing protein n=1 Tax=Zizania palustris TaxID=103762 RepID=A0A8J5W682_ZIZPA|nr:hypothetical protein GUJ93_ZPchr0016g2558 [Zizania palustris]
MAAPPLSPLTRSRRSGRGTEERLVQPPQRAIAGDRVAGRCSVGSVVPTVAGGPAVPHASSSVSPTPRQYRDAVGGGGRRGGVPVTCGGDPRELMPGEGEGEGGGVGGGEEILSVAWIRQLLEVFILCQEVFRVVVVQARRRGVLTAAGERLVVEFRERAVKALDVCNAATDDTERYRQLGLDVVSSLGDDLQNVRRAACLDADALTISVASLGHRLVKANEFLTTGMRSLDEDSGFHRRLVLFVEPSQEQITCLLEEEKRMRSLVRATDDYFHGSTGKDEGLRLFVVVRDFLAILDKVCREVKEQAEAAAKASKKPAPAPRTRSRQSSQSSLSFRDPRQQIQDRRAAAQEPAKQQLIKLL